MSATPRTPTRPILVPLLVLAACGAVYGSSDGLPRGWEGAPYVRYEAEAGALSGTVERTAFDFDPAKTAAEASGRRYVGLAANGSQVQWLVTNAGAGVTLRFTLPDNSTGAGVAGSLDVYVNGTNTLTINLSSHWAWTYFVSSNPQNTPGVRPRMRFDELHFGLPVALQPGDTLALRKTNGDTFEYGIDFLEIEDIPAALPQPQGFVSVASYGANGGDTNSDLTAFNNAWAAARGAKTGLYIPPGRYILPTAWDLGSTTNLSLQGAGIWHTELFFSTKAVGAGGITVGENTENIDISNFFMGSVLNERHIVAGQVADYKAFDGCFGADSSIHDVWITHFEAGAWLGDYVAPIKVSSNFDFVSNRVRNTYADGINLAQGTRNSTVRYCSFRDNGDDAIAVWPSNVNGAPEGHHDVLHHDSIEFTYRAGGAAIFGGYGHEIHHCLFQDGTDNSAIRFNEDFGGYHFANNTSIRVYENTISGRGTSLDLWNGARGAIEISGAGVQRLYFENNDIASSPRHAIQLRGGHDLFFTNTTVRHTGLDSHNAPGGAAVRQYELDGNASFRQLILSDVENAPAIIKELSSYVLTVDNDFPVSDVSSIAVPEGGSAAFHVWLSFQPSSAVTVSVTRASGDVDIAVASGATLVFSVANALVPQTVTLSAAEDADVLEGAATIECSAAGYGMTAITAAEFENDLNHVPVVADDSAETSEGSSADIDVLGNDTDADADALVVSAASGAAHGIVSHDAAHVTYTPFAGYFGPDSFAYTACDGRGGCATGRVGVTVHEVVTPNPYRLEVRFRGYDGAEPLSNFPALIRFDSSLTNFSYSQFASPLGYDLRFRDDAGATLNHEIEAWNTGGVSYVWVQVPVLTNGSRVCATWGSPDNAVAPDDLTRAATWSAGFASVYHASESTGPRRDSATAGRHGTPFGDATAAPGIVDAGSSFDGSGDYVELPSTFVLFNGTVPVTVELWFRARAVAADSNWLTSPVLFQGNGESAWMVTLGDSIAGDAIGNRVDQGGWTTPVWRAGIETGRWYYCATTYTPSGTGNWKLLLDGERVSEATRAGAIGHLTEKNAFGGNSVGTDRWFDGVIDEVRISSVARSSNWIRATWLNIVSNDGFVAFGEIAEPVQPRAPDRSILIDFGSASSYRGVDVTNPDARGHYWNSVPPAPATLVDASGSAGGIHLTYATAYGTDSYNGPAGIVTNNPPSAQEIAVVSIDAAALGDLGVARAAFDYFNGIDQRFTLSGLDASATVTLAFFGSHKYSEDDATVYSVHTDGAYTALVASASLNVQAPGSPWLHNSNSVAVIRNLHAATNGTLCIQFTGANGQAGYLNAMQVDVYDATGSVQIARGNFSNGEFGVWFTGSAGGTLEYTTNLLDGSAWRALPAGGQVVTGTVNGAAATRLVDTNLSDGARAYRVLQTP